MKATTEKRERSIRAAENILAILRERKMPIGDFEKKTMHLGVGVLSRCVMGLRILHEDDIKKASDILCVSEEDLVSKDFPAKFRAEYIVRNIETEILILKGLMGL